MFLNLSISESTMDESSVSDKDRFLQEALDELLIHDSEKEQLPSCANDFQTIVCSLSTSQQTMASSMQRVKVSLKRLHIGKKATRKRRKTIAMSSGFGT